MPCAMTQYGEIMVKVGASVGDLGRWIVPACRLTNELGVTILQDAKGMVLRFADGREVVTLRIKGLHYLKWDEFVPIKEALAKSHMQNR